ncbi:hypothetical protein K438DRAFT_1792966 [Mycena galopus ATCC 62051]|nr:hypothetical protein K438DRAFT_1792966 [Mycena galopus ATCC 62051]
MASDNAMFGLEAPPDTAEDVDSVVSPSSEKSAPLPLTPREPAAPPQPTKVTPPATPSTPRTAQMKNRMKDRNGKIPVKLSQLELPISLTPQTRLTESADNDSLVATQPAEDAAPEKSTRRSTRLTPAASMASFPLVLPEAEQSGKRRRGPNKTPEQRAQEAAAKLAAKEEKERLRKEKAEAKEKEKAEAKEREKAEAKGKRQSPAKAAGKAGAQPDYPDKQDSVPADAAQAVQPRDSTPALSMELPRSGPTHSRTPLSQDEWTVLKPTSPNEEETQESTRDELHSSSPENVKDQAPLFLPAESQVPFPYSQWNSVPEFCPGSPKDSEDEEEEVAASMKPPQSQRPANASTGSYRRLTDIASQPSLFSKTPTLRAMPPVTFPSAKDKRDSLYGKLPQEDEDSTDSDSSSGNVISHIPKSRRAGMATRKR